MKVYKATDKDLKCRGYQFTPGVEAVEDSAELCVSGFHACEAVAVGDKESAAAGDSGSAAAGDSGSAASRGSAEVGVNGVAVARGENPRAKGGLGAVLVLAEEKDDELAHVRTVTVDGEAISPGVWYTLKDVELLEVLDATV